MNDTFYTEDDWSVSAVMIIINGPLSAVIGSIGVLSITVTFAVIARHHTFTRLHYYLLAMSSWDLLVILSAFFLYSFPVMLYDHFPTTEYYLHFIPISFTAVHTSLCGSIWSLTAMAADRYMALCQPMVHRVRINLNRVKKMLLTVTVMSIVYGLPRYFELMLTHVHIEQFNTSVLLLRRSDFGLSPAFKIGYHIIGWVVMLRIFPFLCIFGLTLAISLNQDAFGASPRLSFKRTNGRANNGNNRMQILLCSKMLACYALSIVLDIVEAVISMHGEAPEWYHSLVDASNLLVLLNNSTNCALYYACGKRMRAHLKRLIKCSREPVNEGCNSRVPSRIINLRMMEQELRQALSRAQVERTSIVAKESYPMLELQRKESQNSAKTDDTWLLHEPSQAQTTSLIVSPKNSLSLDTPKRKSVRYQQQTDSTATSFDSIELKVKPVFTSFQCIL